MTHAYTGRSWGPGSNRSKSAFQCAFRISSMIRIHRNTQSGRTVRPLPTSLFKLTQHTVYFGPGLRFCSRLTWNPAVSFFRKCRTTHRRLRWWWRFRSNHGRRPPNRRSPVLCNRLLLRLARDRSLGRTLDLIPSPRHSLRRGCAAVSIYRAFCCSKVAKRLPVLDRPSFGGADRLVMFDQPFG